MSSVLDEVLEGFELSPQIVFVMAGSKSAAVLGLDIGTSGVRAALFAENGSEIEGASVRLARTGSPLEELAVTDAAASLELVTSAIDLLLEKTARYANQIEFISVSCFWHSLVGVDSEQRATTPVLTWADSRSTSAAAELRRRFKESSIHSRTGCRFHPSYWPAKLLWLRNAEPKVFAATRRWLSFGEFLIITLFGETEASVSMASGTGLFNQHTCDWDAEFLEVLELDRACLPEIAGAHRTLQMLTPEFATRWPQLSEARPFPAIGDGAANAIGSGCVGSDKISLMVGTSGAMRVFYQGLPPTTLPPELWCYRADQNRVVLGGALSDGGNLYGWLRESLLPGYDSEAIELALSEVEPDSHGLTVLPFWAGERSPGWSLYARGSLHGLNSRTQPIEILRAAIEAVAYRFALISQALDALAPGAAIIASGTALLASPVWTQMISDVLGRPLTLTESRETSTLGAALLALEAAGKIQTIETTRSYDGRTFEPDMSRHARYQEGIERQQRTYERLVGSETYS
ncbi:MAG: gluconokinase [bacterium]